MQHTVITHRTDQDRTDGLEAAPWFEAHWGDMVTPSARTDVAEQDLLLSAGAPRTTDQVVAA